MWARSGHNVRTVKALASAIGNRLKKAAGFHVEDADDGKIVIGITGGTGAGKTSLLRALERKGAYVLDCDAVYHEMLKDDEPLLRAARGVRRCHFSAGR